MLIVIVDNLGQSELYAFIRVNRQLHQLFADYLPKYNIRKGDGTVLLWATRKRDMPTTQKLIRFGADVNRQITYNQQDPIWKEETINLKEETILHYAVKQGDLSMIRYLFSIEADPTKTCGCGLTPLYWALMEANETIVYEVTNKIKNLATCIVSTSVRLTPLHVAARSGCTSLMEYYIDRGLDIKARDIEGNRPLEHAKMALRSRKWKSSDNSNYYEITRILVMLGESRTRALRMAMGYCTPFGV